VLDELGLPSGAQGRDNAPAGSPVGHLSAVVAADDMQAQVDPRGDAGRGEDVTVIDKEHVRVKPDGWEEPAETVGVAPVWTRRLIWPVYTFATSNDG